jgi:hypothetical protein
MSYEELEPDRESFDELLEGLPKAERLRYLHFTLRNISREFLVEYLEVSEEEMEKIFYYEDDDEE